MAVEYREFTRADTLLEPNDPELPYRRRVGEEKLAVAWGQRKLTMALTQFLTLYWDQTKVPNPIVVYAGSAPGIGTSFVANLFPSVTWHLYDPRNFAEELKKNPKVTIYQRIFTDEDAKFWSGRNDVYFVSDIRTASYTKLSPLENEREIWKDMEKQSTWHKIMQPVRSQLKFRLPYSNIGMPRYLKYLYGTVFKGIWAPQTTTETRLVPAIPDETANLEINWDSLKYESQLFYWNSVIRQETKYLNPYTVNTPEAGRNPIDPPELLNDWDSRSETQVWIDYLTKVGGETAATHQALNALVLGLTAYINNGRNVADWTTLGRLRNNPLLLKELAMVDQS